MTLWYARDVARFLGWRGKSGVQRARRWMKRHGLVDRDGRRFYANELRVRDALPRGEK